MTIGRNNEAPAAYSLTSTIKRLLDHLIEADLYSAKDLTHVAHTLENLREIVRTSDASHSPKLLTLLSNRIELCQGSLTTLQGRLARLGGDLPAIHEKLISILRSISLANTKAKVSRVTSTNSLTSPRSWVHYHTEDGVDLYPHSVLEHRSPKIASPIKGYRCKTGWWKVCVG
jgi:hypothetical protein